MQRAHEQFRWFAGGWGVNADLPTPPASRRPASSSVPTTSPSQIPCGPDLDAIVEAVKPYWEAGFTDVALVQVGDEGQQRFLDEAAAPAARGAPVGGALLLSTGPRERSGILGG